ncbi:kinase-like protein, partial [Hymenopellis radicata]
EADILKTLEHPNVVKFFGYQRIDHEALVFMEFIDGGTVEALAETLGGLDESDAALFTTQILHGLAYLHGQQIIHRSLRGANILVTLQGRIKITEVGCASPIDMKRKYPYRVPVNFEASLYSMSPEMIQDQDYNSRTDIWSLGNVILELIVGGHPWKHEDKGLVYVLRDVC